MSYPIAGLIIFGVAVVVAYIRSRHDVTGWIQGLATTACVVSVLSGLWVALKFYLSHSIYSIYLAATYAIALVLVTVVMAYKGD